MILGDSLQVMASLTEREGLRGKVQCIYFDPPYGIKFNSNFQWSTTSRDGIHGYLTYRGSGSPSPAISSPIPARSSSRSAMKMSTVSGR